MNSCREKPVTEIETMRTRDPTRTFNKSIIKKTNGAAGLLHRSGFED